MADAAWRSGDETEYESYLSEALVIFRSILAISPTGIPVTSITPDTTQGQPTTSGTTLAKNGPLGSLAPPSSDSSDGADRLPN